MPTSYISKLVSEGRGTEEELEAKWARAEKLAEDEGKAENYAYVTTIFKKLVGIKKKKSAYDIVHTILHKAAAPGSGATESVVSNPELGQGEDSFNSALTTPTFRSGSSESLGKATASGGLLSNASDITASNSVVQGGMGGTANRIPLAPEVSSERASEEMNYNNVSNDQKSSVLT